MKRLVSFVVLFGCTEDRITQQPSDSSTATHMLRIENVAPWTVLKSGTVGTGPIANGQRFELRFTAGDGHAINFATMLGESNDWFFAPGPEGIPTSAIGDVTKYVKLWDAGTEIDQELGVGDATAPQQPMPDYGAPDPDPRVREVTSLRVEDLIEVRLERRGETELVLIIRNCSRMPMIHLSPFAWALHRMPAPFFTPGEPDRGEGLERIAEDGNPMELGAALAEVTGFHTPLSPGVVIVNGAPLFEVGTPDFGEGLERIAEDGNPMELAAARPDAIVFDTPVGATMPGPAMPGMAYEVPIIATTGDHIQVVTMFGMSNDWIFAGDTDSIALYDVGTEIDQEIDIGRFTAPQQPAPNTGPKDPDPAVRAADYAVSPDQHVRVTLTPQ